MIARVSRMDVDEKRLVHPNLKARAYLLTMTFQANQTYASVSSKEILMRNSA